VKLIPQSLVSKTLLRLQALVRICGKILKIPHDSQFAARRSADLNDAMMPKSLKGESFILAIYHHLRLKLT
jgi:hypothetical protein